MKKLVTKQTLPTTLDKAWDFFATPGNLNEITPDDMDFKITSEVPEAMYEGLIITYQIKPLMNIPFEWVTEITKVKKPNYFIDEQRKGPYKFWHHEHHFEEVDDGVLMTDILNYEVGKGPIGPFAEIFFVDRKVKQIFNYRYEKLKEVFAGE